MKYLNPFISDVILRIDFAEKEEAIKNSLQQDFIDECLKKFPIKEIYKKTEKQVTVSNNSDGIEHDTVINTEIFNEWHFKDVNKENEIIVTHSFFVIHIKKYSTYQEIRKVFIDLFGKLSELYPSIKGNRFGLRYIDKINLINERKPSATWFDFWKKYINKDILGNLKYSTCERNLSRCLSVIEMNFEEYMFRFQYGIHNQDYPAIVKKEIFILDADLYSMGLFDINDIQILIDKFHEKAKEWFENSITDNLRDKMGIITNE